MLTYHYSPSVGSCYVLQGIACTQCAIVPEDLLVMRSYFSTRKQAIIKLLCKDCMRGLQPVLGYGFAEKRFLLVAKDRFELPKDCIMILPQAPQVVNGRINDGFDPKRDMADATRSENYCVRSGREGYTFDKIETDKDVLLFSEIASPESISETRERLLELDKPPQDPAQYLEDLRKAKPTQKSLLLIEEKTAED